MFLLFAALMAGGVYVIIDKDSVSIVYYYQTTGFASGLEC